MGRFIAGAIFAGFLVWLGISLVTNEIERSEALAVEMSKPLPALGRARHRD